MSCSHVAVSRPTLISPTAALGYVTASMLIALVGLALTRTGPRIHPP